MFKSLGAIFAKALQSLFNFLARTFSGLLELLWSVLKPAFEGLFSLLGTIWGRVLATLTLLVGLALGPLVDVARSGFQSFASTLGAPPDVISSLFPDNFQALCYVAVNYCSLDIMLSSLIIYLGVLGAGFAFRVSVWGARKIASVVRGAGV